MSGKHVPQASPEYTELARDTAYAVLMGETADAEFRARKCTEGEIEAVLRIGWRIADLANEELVRRMFKPRRKATKRLT